MNDIDTDGYYSRPIHELLANPDLLLQGVPELTDTEADLLGRVGPGASWPPAGPMVMKGAAPYLLERWIAFWKAINDAQFDHRSQVNRLRRLREIAQELNGATRQDVALVREFRKIEQALQPPRVVDGPLWGVATELGLILVLGSLEEVQAHVETRHCAELRHPEKEQVVLVTLEAGVLIDQVQAPYWAWAAEQVGCLFRLVVAA